MNTTQSIGALMLVATTLVTGCANNNSGSASQPYASSQAYDTYGVIDTIRVIRVGNESSSGAGAVIGGVVGGVLGNQVGSGNGRAAATAAGVVGGALAGNAIERNNNNGQTRDAYQIGVRLDNGSYQTITQDSVTDLRVGSRVHIQNDRVYRY